MKSQKLIKVSKGLYCSGGTTVMYQSWEKRFMLPWVAVWNDIFSAEHKIRAETFDDLNRKLQPYGMKFHK